MRLLVPALVIAALIASTLSGASGQVARSLPGEPGAQLAAGHVVPLSAGAVTPNSRALARTAGTLNLDADDFAHASRRLVVDTGWCGSGIAGRPFSVRMRI